MKPRLFNYHFFIKGGFFKALILNLKKKLIIKNNN